MVDVDNMVAYSGGLVGQVDWFGPKHGSSLILCCIKRMKWTLNKRCPHGSTINVLSILLLLLYVPWLQKNW